MSTVSIPVYWWNTVANFGDVLNVALLRQLCGINPRWTRPEGAHIVATGSILEMLPDGWNGVVAGAGKKRGTPTRDLSHADIRALRGPLSAAQVQGDISRAVIGDPGLLAPDLIADRPGIQYGKYSAGVIPHWSDKLLGADWTRGQTLIETLTTSPVEVIAQIAECRSIITSSLHGLIVADALGIPAQVEMAGQVWDEGGTFKFEDYSASVGVDFRIGKMRTAPRENVERIQTALRGVFDELRQRRFNLGPVPRGQQSDADEDVALA